VSKYILNAVKKLEDTEDPLNFQISFDDDLLPPMSEIARDLSKQGWDVKTLRETLLPWDLSES